MLIFWDIDGTLLTTGRAGIFAWQDSLREFTGVSTDLEEFDTAGLPDYGIARRLLATYAGILEPDSDQLSELVRGYEARLPAALHTRIGRVLPNVRPILERLAGEPGVCSLLLTGNTQRGARAKLAHYGLLEFFQKGGFSERDDDRQVIARTALEHARSAGCSAELDRTFVIGDTPHDVHCGTSIGARTIAVATGRHTPEELSMASPWRVLPELPPAPTFMAILTGTEVTTDV
jgi:phosphoglycolate phosphatase-like HAD superfamily hydrolase